MTIQVAWALSEWKGFPPPYIYGGTPAKFFLAPHTTEKSAFIEIAPAQTLVEWANKPWPKPEPIIIIWGRADYEDTFGRRHFVEWCRSLRFERHDGKEMRAGFIQWGDYNRAD
jgi:hypothetical protein